MTCGSFVRGLGGASGLHPVSWRCGHRYGFEASDQYRRPFRQERHSGSHRLRAVPGSEGVARAQLARHAGSGQGNRRDHSDARPPRPLRMDSAPGERRIPRADLCHSADHRFVRHHSSRLRPPAGRRRALLQQDEEVEARSCSAALHLSKRRRTSLQYFKPVHVGQDVPLSPDLSFRFVRAAHILGSCMAGDLAQHERSDSAIAFHRRHWPRARSQVLRRERWCIPVPRRARSPTWW